MNEYKKERAIDWDRVNATPIYGCISTLSLTLQGEQYDKEPTVTRCTLLIFYLEGKATLLSLIECISHTNGAAQDPHHTLEAWQARG
jgi:hypothetical protein